MTEARKKYFVRFSKEADFDKILAFYDVNEHKNIFKRKAELIQERTEKGAIVLIEDEAGAIVAASVTYAHEVTGKDGVTRAHWQEFGTTRSILKGYSLGDAMIPLQLLRTFLVEPPEGTFVMRTMTTQVQGLASVMGWRRMEGGPSDELLAAMQITIAENDHTGKTNWFVFGTEAIPTAAQLLKNFVENPVIKNAKTGEEIEIDFSKSNFFNMFKDDMLKLAGQDFGDVDKPDNKQNLRQKRDKWLKKHFR